MQWTTQQAKALAEVARWASSPSAKQVFRLFGYAGTGKSTLAKEVANALRGDSTQYLAYTGKAALVMKSKGCGNAQTIHSAIYRVKEDETTGAIEFELNEDAEIRDKKLIVVDECSMVDSELGADLLSFGIKILVLGDPFQLPPAGGEGVFTSSEPDIMLTDVHRQAEGSPIIRLSMDVREGRRLAAGDYGGMIIKRCQLDACMALDADQILVGKNATRRAYNRRMRSLLGIDTLYPLTGDKLVCLRNNRDKSLLNGGVWTVTQAERLPPQGVNHEHPIRLRVTSNDCPGLGEVEIEVPAGFFTGDEDTIDWRVKRKYDEFTYGYALTVHKSQGSQWDNVLVLDESSAFREDAARWKYTAITRASERLTMVI